MTFGKTMNLLARVAVLALFAVFCQVGAAQAQVAPDDPNYANIVADPNISSTCDNDAVYQQYNALNTYMRRVVGALKRTDQDSQILKESYDFSFGVAGLFFCPIKITAITNLVNVASTIAAGIMSAVMAAIQALVTTLIQNVVNAICQSVLGAIQSLVAGLCIPNISLNFKVPEFSFRGGGNPPGCAGTPLVTVTGGPPVIAPPLNFGASLPNSNMQNGLVTIR